MEEIKALKATSKSIKSEENKSPKSITRPAKPGLKINKQTCQLTCNEKYRGIYTYLTFILMGPIYFLGPGQEPSLTWPRDGPDYSAVDAEPNGTCTPVTLLIREQYIVMDNGLIKVNLTNPTGSVAAIQYQGIDNVLEPALGLDERGYWDIDWNRPKEESSRSVKILATNFTVISKAENQVEVSFTKTLAGDPMDIPINFDKRYVMLPGRSGFYTYAIYDHPQGSRDVDIDQTRVVFKLSRSLFHYMAVTDEIQGEMPSYEEREAGQVLDYKEAVLLTKAENPKLEGKVDDKYQYALESKDMNVYGWISAKPHVGFWVITASNEFRSGGPIKQDLTCHCGPFALSMFISLHYAGPEWGVKLRDGEPWKKVFGPVYLYLNTDTEVNHKTLWEEAKKQMLAETKSWPYNFLKSEDYVIGNQRGSVSGRLLVHDEYVNKVAMPAKFADIGLAQPGNPGSWQFDAKGYQFWSQTDSDGNFMIPAIIPGTYSLYAWVPGHLGDFKHKVDLVIKPGDTINVGDIVHAPPRNGTTLWEISIPDRKAWEFFIPDPVPELKNYLLNNRTEKFREYGLWDRYTDFYPEKDLVYKVGESDHAKHWFFAQISRKHAKDHYVPTIWTILFSLEDVNDAGTYTLRVALASSTSSTLKIWINSDPLNRKPTLTIHDYGKDNAIARHGIHGLYSEYNLSILGSHLVKGENMLKLRPTKAGYPFHGVMYDYIRLEGPSTLAAKM